MRGRGQRHVAELRVRGPVLLRRTGQQQRIDGRPVRVRVVALGIGQERVQHAVADVEAVHVLAVDGFVARDPGRADAE